MILESERQGDLHAASARRSRKSRRQLKEEHAAISATSWRYRRSQRILRDKKKAGKGKLHENLKKKFSTRSQKSPTSHIWNIRN